MRRTWARRWRSGERTPLALIDGPRVRPHGGRRGRHQYRRRCLSPDIGDIKLSANWMCAAGHPGEDATLFDTVRAVGMELCPALGISIPVGKDSMSMRTTWRDPKNGEEKSVTAPVSLIVSAFAPVTEVRRTLTPQLRTDAGETELVLVDLGGGRNRLGGSILAQCFSRLGGEAPDLDDPAVLGAFFAAIQKLNAEGKLLAYHDRSDGGLFATVCEMAFAGRAGVTMYLDNFAFDASASTWTARSANPTPWRGDVQSRVLAALFSEELGRRPPGAPGRARRGDGAAARGGPGRRART
jgi:phosphoribosylformylglycinamidine synthase